ncbi:hypothetical protein [Robertmurraya sp. P23]|uniref:hypothetical protein n=1 Tax=Robertmurraya sp. P23 TaxID=3436931 RepID=UPI003D9522EC
MELGPREYGKKSVAVIKVGIRFHEPRKKSLAVIKMELGSHEYGKKSVGVTKV